MLPVGWTETTSRRFRAIPARQPTEQIIGTMWTSPDGLMETTCPPRRRKPGPDYLDRRTKAVISASSPQPEDPSPRATKTGFFYESDRNVRKDLLCAHLPPISTISDKPFSCRKSSDFCFVPLVARLDSWPVRPSPKRKLT